MPFIERQGQEISGVFENRQPGIPVEFLEANDPELRAFTEKKIGPEVSRRELDESLIDAILETGEKKDAAIVKLRSARSPARSVSVRTGRP